YAEWVLTEQRRLADAYQGALEQLLRLLENEAQWERSIEYAHRLLRLNPIQEDSCATLMRCYAAVGRPLDALRQYQELEKRLNEELRESPSAPLRALAERIERTAGRLPHTETPASSSPPDMPRKALGESTGSPGAMPDPTPPLPLTFTRFF